MKYIEISLVAQLDRAKCLGFFIIMSVQINRIKLKLMSQIVGKILEAGNVKITIKKI